MKRVILKSNLRKATYIEDVPLYLSGYTNFIAESKIVNKLYEGPSLGIIHLVPKRESFL